MTQMVTTKRMKLRETADITSSPVFICVISVICVICVKTSCSAVSMFA